MTTVLPRLMHYTSFSERAPACDPAGHACREDVGGRGEADGLDGVGELQWIAELQQCNVIVKGHMIVIWVGDDSFQCAALYTILLVLDLHATVGLPVGGNTVPMVAPWDKCYFYN